jgi:hypothetical protein
LPRLKSMNIPTKRPEDYFAQMAKTDEHMQKVLVISVEKCFIKEILKNNEVLVPQRLIVFVS